MPQDTTLNQLVIHKLTQAQYEAIVSPNANELYLTPDDSSYPHVTQTYTDSQTGSWYRIWSDGWCEQGGSLSTSDTSATLTLLQAYRDTHYSGTVYNQTAPYTDTYNLSFRPMTTALASVLTGTENASVCMWTAQGYIA